MTAKEKSVVIFNALVDTAKNIRGYNKTIEDIQRRSDLDEETKSREVIIAETRRNDYRENAHSQIKNLIAEFVKSERDAHAIKMVDLMSNPVFGSTSHQLTVNNALQIISIMGDKMTAPTLQRVITPLIRSGDLLTLETLKEVTSITVPHLYTTGMVDFGPGLTSRPLECAEGMAKLAHTQLDGSNPEYGLLEMFFANKINETFGEGTVVCE